MSTSSKTQKSAANPGEGDAVTGAPKSGKAHDASGDEGDISTSSKTQKSAAATDAATGAPKSGKSYYASGAPKAPKTGKAYNASGAPKSANSNCTWSSITLVQGMKS